MNCQQVQTELSLYLYGELEFAREEQLEQHLATCAFCQVALSREKAWHTALNGERADVPLDLLSECRRDLRTAMKSATAHKPKRGFSWHMPEWLDMGVGRWSTGLAAASFFVFLGFTLSNFIGHFHTAGSGPTQMSLLGTRVRDIQPSDNGRVRIIVDQVQQRELTGSLEDQDIRQLLLAASKDAFDPGLRADSVEILKGQDGSDVRDALLSTARHDTNAAVRLKALEGLRRFSNEHATRDTLRYVLEHDDDPAVRSEAIDVLVPANGSVHVNPELAATLEEIFRSGDGDDYVRSRCAQVLHRVGTPAIY
jgi:HEAT repeats/Putative zinc-finger